MAHATLHRLSRHAFHQMQYNKRVETKVKPIKELSLRQMQFMPMYQTFQLLPSLASAGEGKRRKSANKNREK
jgi:hypothetical protein